MSRLLVSPIVVFLAGCFPAPNGDIPPDFESSLPIIAIDTEGVAIQDEPKVPAKVRVYGRLDGANAPSRHEPTLEALAAIETRGRSSQKNFPKSQYDLEFRTGGQGPLSVPMLDMPADPDWILYGPYTDKTLLRNFLTYTLARSMGRYAVRGRFIELFVSDGDASAEPYRGVYLLTEKIGRGKQRVDLPRESGYLLKLDALDPSDDRFVVTERGLRVIIVYPRARDLTENDEAFLETFFDGFERALHSGEREAYRRQLDIGALVDYLVIAELSKNIDTFRTSTYMHLERGGPLVMGPVWDFNQAYGNSGYHPRSVRLEGWRSDLADTTAWLDALRADRMIADEFERRWRELRESVLGDDALLELIDETAKRLEPAAARNFTRWPILGKHILGNPRPVPRTYRAEIRELRKWILARARWIDAHAASFGKDPS